MIHAAFLIPLFPLAGFFVLAAFGQDASATRGRAGSRPRWSSRQFRGHGHRLRRAVRSEHRRRGSSIEPWFTWFSAGRLNVGVGLSVDPLSMTMATFVTGVSTLIHLYSIGYMDHDRDFPKFFLYLNLFVFSMLMLVLGGQLPRHVLRLGRRRRLLVLPDRVLVRARRRRRALARRR